MQVHTAFGGTSWHGTAPPRLGAKEPPLQKSSVRTSLLAGTILVLALSLASPASAHTQAGTTWWSNGSTSMTVSPGGTVRAYAVGARPGVGYVLTIGRQAGQFDLCHGGTPLNPTTVYAGPSGLIGTVTGTVDVPSRQTYEVAFCGPGTVIGAYDYTRTSPVFLTVMPSGVDGGVD